MAFVLNKKPSASFWDTVKFEDLTEDGEWAEGAIRFKFKRLTADEIDAHSKRVTELEEKHGKLTMDQRVELALSYCEDWDVESEPGVKTPLTADALRSLFNLYPGLQVDVWLTVVRSRYGRREKNS